MPLVLLPGMNCSPRLWEEVADLLPEPVEVVAPHLPGTSIDDAVARLAATLPDRFALAGLSLGGIVAMAMARLLPAGRIERLALLDTNARPPTPGQMGGWTAALADLDGGTRPRDVQRSLLPLLLGPGAAADPRLVASTLDMADEVGPARLADQLRLQLTRVDERPRLARIGVPALVLTGADDALCPLARHEEIAALVPGARLAVVPGAGHLSPLERPAEVAAELTAWLARPEEGRPGGARREGRSEGGQ
ncbi:alpha/beta fold hydrolase [Agilicoccus flavus]|uniref:alpha/beta fold hydrolase n=1 Tax=Agilicoccus flavus TaxID=2775968 RepID=UPI001CF6EE8E|nr:alpha/beta fold hydrolase [Agilicoccus flavus]